MTRKEALELARKVRDEKLLFNLYEKNKFKINEKGYVGYEKWKNRVVANMESNPKYEGTTSLFAAGKRTLRTKEYMTRDELGIQYTLESLKSTKTGRHIRTKGKADYNVTGLGTVEGPRFREETMYDVLRSKVGIGKKVEMWYDKDSKSFLFYGIAKEYDEDEERWKIVPDVKVVYQIITNQYKNITNIVEAWRE